MKLKQLLFDYLSLAYLLQIDMKPENETEELARDIFNLDPS